MNSQCCSAAIECAPNGQPKCIACGQWSKRHVDSAVIMARIRERCDTDASGCWVWRGSKNPAGYGVIGVDVRKHLVHRLSFTASKGDIGNGNTIDHTCRNKPCANPEHLESVTLQENLRRGVEARGGLITHCKRGHEYTTANTYINGKRDRICRECNRIRAAKRYAERPINGHPADHRTV